MQGLARLARIESQAFAGLREGCKVMVLGSKEADVQKILNSRDLPGMAGFDHELRTIAARRKRQKDATVQLPLGISNDSACKSIVCLSTTLLMPVPACLTCLFFVRPDQKRLSAYTFLSSFTQVQCRLIISCLLVCHHFSE